MTHDELIQMKKGYIDVHCHVIPHIDDGARTTSQALRMIGIAYKNGIRTMILNLLHWKLTKMSFRF